MLVLLFYCNIMILSTRNGCKVFFYGFSENKYAMEFIKGKGGTSEMNKQVVSLPNCDDTFSYCDQPFNDKRIWLGNVDKTVPEYLILKLVQKFGELDKFDFPYVAAGPERGKPRGYCFVTYKDVSAANKAIKELNGYCLKNSTLVVRLAHKPGEKRVSSQSIGKRSQIEEIEAKLRATEKEETSTVKHKLLASAPPVPLMKLNIKRPSKPQSTIDVKRKKSDR